MEKAFELCGLKVKSYTLEPSLGFRIRPSESNPNDLVIEQEDADVQMIVLNSYEAQQLAQQLLVLVKKANEE